MEENTEKKAVGTTGTSVTDDKGTKKPENEEEMYGININIRTHRGEVLQLQVSPVDTVQEIKHYLFDSPETCDITSFSLSLNGTILNEWIELSDAKEIGLVPDCELQMVFDPYNENSIMLHIRRLREILSSHLLDISVLPSPTVLSNIIREPVEILPEGEGMPDAQVPVQAEKSQSKDQKTQKGNSKSLTSKNASKSDTPQAESNDEPIFADTEQSELEDNPLSLMYPDYDSVKAAETQDPFLYFKEIKFSGWNPPPRNRCLLGDLVYLEVVTLENKTFHITGWTDGFYINSSSTTKFRPNPIPGSARGHTLSDLLSKVSPKFRKNFKAFLTTGQYDKHPFELMPVAYPIIPWLGTATHSYPFDPTRADYSILESQVENPTTNFRDWNEDYQKILELPQESVQDRIIRDKNLVKIHNEFVQCAIRGACAIVTKAIAPVNPHLDDSEHIYIHNNIYFSYANDDYQSPLLPKGNTPKSVTVSNPPSNESSDEILEHAYEMAANDLKGVQMLNELDVRDLSTLLTTVIDYRGYRLTAQSLVPGVVYYEETNLQYGSLDKGKTVYCNEKFHKMLQPIAKKLHLKEHALDSIKPEPKKEKDAADKDKSEDKEAEEGEQEKNAPTMITQQSCFPAEVKGLKGTDGRKYIVDLIRMTPRDANVTADYEDPGVKQAKKDKQLKDPKFMYAILRRELIQQFIATIQLIFKHATKPQPALKEAPKETQTDTSKPGEEKTTQENPANASKDTPAKEEAPTKEDSTEAPTDTPTPAEETTQENPSDASDDKDTKESPDTTEKPNETPKTQRLRPFYQDVTNLLISEGYLTEDSTPEEYTEALLEKLTYFNPNVLMLCSVTKETADDDQKTVELLGKFLVQIIIPKLSKEFAGSIPIPIDGCTLKGLLHRRGINLRYLGMIANLCKKLQEDNTPSEEQKEQPIICRRLQKRRSLLGLVIQLCEQEMVIRTAKKEFRSLMRQTNSEQLAHSIAHFVNCLFANTSPRAGSKFGLNMSEEYTVPGKQYTPGKRGLRTCDAFAYGSRALWKRLTELVQAKFNYSLPSKRPDRLFKNVAALRSFCLKVGLQIKLPDIPGKQEPSAAFVTPDDILDQFPTTKYLDPLSHDARDLLDAGKSFLQQGRLEYAHELLSEALAICHQVYGPMHMTTAACYGQLAMVLFHAGEKSEALNHQKKMVLIQERCLGLDHPETAHSYGNLALFYRDLKMQRQSLYCLKRAFFLMNVACGMDTNNEEATNLNHLATVYQDLGIHEMSLYCLKQALGYFQKVVGKESLEAASICHLIAFAYSVMEKFRLALTYEKQNYSILLKMVRKNDFKIVESNIWLKQFTAKAVQMEIENKKPKKIAAKQQITKRKQEQVKKVKSQKARKMGDKPVSELLEYINGKPTAATNGASNANGKRRKKNRRQRQKKEKS